MSPKGTQHPFLAVFSGNRTGASDFSSFCVTKIRKTNEILKNNRSSNHQLSNSVPTVCPKAAASHRLENFVQAKQQVS